MAYEKKFYSITEIVEVLYCEQKVVFDRKYGDARPAKVKAKAADGTIEHMRFEAEGKTQAAIDRVKDQRRFNASAVYGQSAYKTESLRRWGARGLMSSMLGRLAAKVYYKLSPWFWRIARKKPIARKHN